VPEKSDVVWAENINYWKTGRSSPDTWIAKARRELESVGGVVTGEGFGQDTRTGRAAYMLAFELEDLPYRIVWPVLLSKNGDHLAARRQAATALYHDVKARCVSLRFLGSGAMFGYLVLPDGRQAATVSAPELAQMVPTRLLAASTTTD